MARIARRAAGNCHSKGWRGVGRELGRDGKDVLKGFF